MNVAAREQGQPCVVGICYDSSKLSQHPAPTEASVLAPLTCSMFTKSWPKGSVGENRLASLVQL